VAPLILKLVLVPFLLAAVSAAGSRLGPRVAGVLMGLPAVAGPLALLLTLEQGAGFGASAARATLASVLSIGVFCVVYARACERSGWSWSLCLALLGFGASTVAWNAVVPPFWLVLPLALATPPAVLALTPHPNVATLGARLPKREIALRMIPGALLVLAVTGAARTLGSRLSGLLVLFPIATSVLAVSAQRSAGPSHAALLLRGLALGLYSLTAFFATLALTLERWGVAAGFALALLASLTVQLGTLLALAPKPAPRSE
jgi:uncharacterized membrane protein (GlpM family)